MGNGSLFARFRSKAWEKGSSIFEGYVWLMNIKLREGANCWSYCDATRANMGTTGQTAQAQVCLAASMCWADFYTLVQSVAASGQPHASQIWSATALVLLFDLESFWERGCYTPKGTILKDTVHFSATKGQRKLVSIADSSALWLCGSTCSSLLWIYGLSKTKLGLNRT